jgi:protein-S-isoprenylcysteine O-methyltransferase Ste14
VIVLTLGGFFFRWRSYLPLLLLPMVCVAIARFQHRWSSHGADLLWEAGCMGLALLGQALRVWTVGVAAPGTSGRNTRHQKAAALNTTGPYSVVRHPLYVANIAIGLALAVFSHTWVGPPFVGLAAAAYYYCIARREDAYLAERFGAAFHAWALRVPRCVPNVFLYVPADRPFDWRTVVRREFYGVCLILIAPMLLDAIEDAIEEGVVALDPVWTVTALVGTVLFVVLRALKKRQGGRPRRPGRPRESVGPQARG